MGGNPGVLCIKCKGSRYLCGNRPCPLLSRINLVPKINQKLSKDFFGPSTSIFIGHNFYPNVGIGPLSTFELKPNIDNPEAWFGMNYSDIIDLRSSLIRSRTAHHIKIKSKLVEQNQLLAVAKKPADTEITFKKKPVLKVTISDIHQPMGPTAPLERLKITENIKVARQVDKVLSDELKAVQAAKILFDKNTSVYKIMDILSSGALGLEKNKKLVPTRWSITASDDIVTKELLKDVRNYPSINEFLVYSSNFLDNHFEILLMPGNWEYEGFEAWQPGSSWYQGAGGSHKTAPVIVPEYEPFQGRTKYAFGQAGGYYAARFAVVEFLSKIKRQARVIVFREIYEGYTIPIGVWQVRENVRNAFRNAPLKFNTQSEALNHISSKLRFPLENYKKISKIIKQKRLLDFF